MSDPAARDLANLLLREYRPDSRLRVPRHEVLVPACAAIDAHAHLGRWLTGGRWAVPDVAELLALMDACGLIAIVNMDGRWGEELEANLDRYDRSYPGRFATLCHVDWAKFLLEPDPARHLVTSLERSVRAGARGLKVWKDLGLRVRDVRGRLVLPDDPRLDPLWDTAAQLRVPVAIHTADPVAFFDVLGPANERLEELLAHPEWSLADPSFPRFERLMEALESVVARHPRTTFIGVHVGCYAEDLAWVSRMLDTYDNFSIDIAQRIAELGRQPRLARALILRHPGRVLFGTDQIPPESATYRIYFRFLQTANEHFPYSVQEPPPWGRWRISGIDLPSDVLSAVYAENCRRLFPRL